MPCEPEILKHVPPFARIDDDEVAVLAAQVEIRTFAPAAEPGGALTRSTSAR